MLHHHPYSIFFFNDTATTEIYTLSLHDALPISPVSVSFRGCVFATGAHPSPGDARRCWTTTGDRDRKSTRLNSSHTSISYAIFSLKKKDTTRPSRSQILAPHYTQINCCEDSAYI